MKSYLMNNAKKAIQLIITFFCLSFPMQSIANSPEIHPDMLPEYSTMGNYNVGVKTIVISDENYIEPLTQEKGRALTLEIWYPSRSQITSNHQYEDVMRSGKTLKMTGEAQQGLPPYFQKDFPLIVMSHGYTGYRTIMFPLAEHLASRGYVVVSIDHTDSTNTDIDFEKAPFAGFPSTLLHRSWDQHLVLDYFSQSENIQTVFSKDITWKAEKAGLIGFSMGGFGVLNSIGACYTFPNTFVAQLTGSTDKDTNAGFKSLLNTCAGGQNNENHSLNNKWQAAIAYAPWGGAQGIFNNSFTPKVDVPLLIVSGDQDDISHYEGTKDIFESINNPDTFLLTYINARHNIAVHEPPENAWEFELDFGHYYEPAWSSKRLNQINSHFSTVMFDCYLKAIKSSCEYLDLPPESHQKQVDGSLGEPWKGFDNRYSTGMRWASKKK